MFYFFRPLRQVSSWDNPDVMAAGRPKSRTPTTEPDIDEDLWSCSEMSNSDDDDSTTTNTTAMLPRHHDLYLWEKK